MYDYLIVGSGLFGATVARLLTDGGKRCLVLEKRPHIAGNVYTERMHGIDVHVYGPHIFHTNNRTIWDFVTTFATFLPYRHTVRASVGGKIYPIPVNLMTLQLLWGITNPSEARERMLEETTPYQGIDQSTAEGWCLAHYGKTLYELFFKGYTEKQWGRPASELPAKIVARIPTRLDSWNETYFGDMYEGIPEEGYTAMVGAMLRDITVLTSTNYLKDRAIFDTLANTIIYSGPIDELFDHDEGALEYRSLHFSSTFHRSPYPVNVQGIAQINYPEASVPYTRIVEHRHFKPGVFEGITVYTKEFPAPFKKGSEPFYPINDAKNTALAQRYIERATALGYIVGGRLGTYQYYDMHQVVAQGMKTASQLLLKEKR